MRLPEAASIVAAALACSAAGIAAADAPRVIVQPVPGTPGWMSVAWVYEGEEDADGFLVQREQPPEVWSAQTTSGNLLDKNLQASTVYRYRACAVFGGTTECSDWEDQRTAEQPPPQPEHPKPPPKVTRHEAYHAPMRIRIWWEKTGDYKRIIVRWRPKTSSGARQEDIDTSARQGTYDLHTPVPGTYVVLLKGCTLNFVGAANCGDWSPEMEFQTATLGAARVDCIPGTLKAGSPRYEASGRAEYHFENPPAGYNTVAGFCQTPDRTVVGSYVVHGLWNPTSGRTAWDQSGANATETFFVRLWPTFSADRAPQLPDVFDPSTTISFLTRAQCDRDPWLNPDATCRRTGNNMPQDIRDKWPTLLNEPFPHTRSAIPAAQLAQLRSQHRRATGQLAGAASSPVGSRAATSSSVAAATNATANATAAAKGTATATETVTATRGRGRAEQPVQQTQTSKVNPAAEVMLNPQPLPPKTKVVQPEAPVVAPAAQSRTQVLTRAATTVRQSPVAAPARTPPPPQPEGAIPANLFEQDDRAIIIVGGKETTAGKLKAELHAELRSAAGTPAQVRSIRTAQQLVPAGISQDEITRLQNATPRDAGKRLVAGAANQSAIPAQGQATPPAANARLENANAPTLGGRARFVEMDCAALGPRIGQLPALKAGEALTIEGSCFGREPGKVELIGLPTGKVTMSFTSWTENSIAAVMPALRGVQDQRLAMTIVRHADRKTSPPREVAFIAAKESVRVPAGRWSPSARVHHAQVRHDVYERGLLGVRTDDYRTGRMPPGVEQLRVQVHPACALEGVGTTPTAGAVWRILGWENGPPHQADISVEWAPACTRRTERNQVTGEQWSTFICAVEFTMDATAHCPVGIAP